MIKNYIKIAWRNIKRHRFFSIVNIVGLFTGILFTLLIGAYIWGELQVNKKLRNHQRQYILTTISKDPNIGYELATFGPLAKRLKEDYPHLVANYYRYDGITSVVSKADKNFREGLQVGDSNLLNMYGFEILHGDAKTALNDPYSVVITSDKAIKYFGKTGVVGESITIQSFSGGKHDFKITAVLKEIPQSTVTELAKNYKNSFFIPMNTVSFFGRQDVESWSNIFIASYVELKKGVTAKDIEKPIKQLIQQNAHPALHKVITVKPVLLSDYHLQQDNGLVKRMLYTLAFTGLFILLMAIVNFINIAISRSSARMREIGIRKVLGGLKRQLILQFLFESIILVCIAMLLAIAAYPLLKPMFEQIVGKQVPELSSFPLYFVLVPVGIVFIVGLLAGLYPAFVLSSLKSVDSLKGKLKTVKQNFLLRKSLVGFQFAVAIIVLVAAAVVAGQVAYFFGRGLGYNKEYIVSSQVPRDWTIDGVRKMATVRNEFATMPQVSNISLSYEIPDGANAGQVPVYKSGSDSTSAMSMQLLQTDENYLSTYEVPLKAGNFFDNRGLDSGKVVINEKALAALGLKNPEEAIGQQLRIPGDPTVFTIKGVSKDFHFGSMQKAIPPILFFNVRYSPFYRYLSFKLKPGSINATIETIQKKWSQLLPGSSFEYTFMDDTLEKLYASELQLKKAAYTSTVLALIIVLLGVLGLVSLSIQKRTKEIGIRKVLGASVSSIISLFMKEFVWVILVAGFIACPLAWFIMQGWLNDYAYRISLTAEPFIISIAGLGVITIMLIALQTIKAGLENPVKSLRTE
ncbi:ABC transporter permease [Terrimonas pollutisoli]|uniref:ABC transporter permease n=1 Tax=Terrimonas pollutisoli TaxID=3034147 RepID=UPI0023ECFFEA|nr:ABC transporter permease [Terrimonas sp. H1YJ31]